jgi:hypothetical protein
VVAHEMGAVEFGPWGLTPSSGPCTLNKLPWIEPELWFVMVCVCSLRTQQCAEMLVPCLFCVFVFWFC